MHLQRPLILASASPRRRRLLEKLDLDFDTQIPTVIEISIPDDPPKTAQENARLKYTWCHSREPGALIIAADTVIDLDGRLIGKPQSREEAANFLRAFSGREHNVLTAVALTPHRACSGARLTNAGDTPAITLVISRVRFRPLSPRDIDAYLDVVHPLDKAGAYDIDDHGAMIIAGYDGSWSNITGLPMEIITPWLARWSIPAPTP